MKKEERELLFFGAGSRGRTDTVLLPSDFESDASANSTIPAFLSSSLADNGNNYIISLAKNQYFLEKLFEENRWYATRTHRTLFFAYFAKILRKVIVFYFKIVYN